MKYALTALSIIALITYIDSVWFPANGATPQLDSDAMRIVTQGSDEQFNSFVRLVRKELGDKEYYMWLRVVCPVREELKKEKYDVCVVLQF